MGGPGSGPNDGNHMGIKFGPLTKLELATLQMLADGYRPREFLREGEKLHAVHMRIDRMRYKLDALTTEHMMVIATKKGLVK